MGLEVAGQGRDKQTGQPDRRCGPEAHYEHPLVIPEGTSTIVDFQKKVISGELRRVVTEAQKAIAPAIEGHPGLSREDRAKHVFLIHLALDELVSNAFYHGMLGLNSEEGRIVRHPDRKLGEDEIAAKLVAEKLASDEVRARRGNLLVEVRGDTVSIEISDGGKFPEFERRWGELKRGENLPADDQQCGRGLVILADYFTAGEQLPDGTLVFRRSLIEAK